MMVFLVVAATFSLGYLMAAIQTYRNHKHPTRVLTAVRRLLYFVFFELAVVWLYLRWRHIRLFTESISTLVFVFLFAAELALRAIERRYSRRSVE